MSPEGAGRDVRSGRHDLGRASDVHGSHLLLDRVPALVSQHPELKDKATIQDCPRGRPRGDRQAADEGPRRDPRRDALRHASEQFASRSEGLACEGEASALEAALYRTRLSADARSHALPAGQRLQDLHRDRRHAALRARLRRAGLRHSAGANHRHGGRNEVHAHARTATYRAGPEAAAEQQQCREAEESICSSAAGPIAAFGNSPATSRCWNTPRPAPAPGLACSCCTTTPSANMRMVPPGAARHESRHLQQALYDEAIKRGWFVISIKKDWKRVFAFDP